MKTRSLFITFEGPEGGGKTTQIELLRGYLTERGHQVLVTRQPGGDPVGVELRKIMLDIGRANVSPRAELLMMMADRSQSVDTVVRPHLSKGGVVICDRYADSSIAYQGGGRGIDQSWIANLNAYATDSLTPDITFLLDLGPEVGLSRQQDKNKMEEQDFSFHQRVRSEYLALAAEFPERIRVVDASQSIDSVHANILEILQQWEML